MFLKRLVLLCLILSSFALASAPDGTSFTDTELSAGSKFDIKRKKLNGSKSGFLNPASLFSSPSAPTKKKHIIVRNIAIIGGGGAGCIIAALLSNLSQEAEQYGLRFVITIFERNPEIINGSTFESASVLHAGGGEYAKDPATAAECQMTGALFKKIFPDLYGTDDSFIPYLSRTDSDLTPEIQQETDAGARAIRASLNLPTSPKNMRSQKKWPREAVQTVFNTNFSGGMRSEKDRPMDIFTRNATLKKYISNKKNITIRANTHVFSITKNEANTLSIIHSGGVTIVDHAFLTAWSGNPGILETSRDTTSASSSSLSEFTKKDRVVALCDISLVHPLDSFSRYGLTEGEMLVAYDRKIGLACSCKEGGTYPKAGAIEIPEEDILSHGQTIVNEVAQAFATQNIAHSPFSISLLGANLLEIVLKIDISLEKRRYEPPVVTPKGLIVVTPPKATYIGSAAFQAIEQFLRQLPVSCLDFSDIWIKNIQKIVPGGGILYTYPKFFPEVFTIRCLINKKDILTEKVKFFESFQLTSDGRLLFQVYQEELSKSSGLITRSKSIPNDPRVQHDYQSFYGIGSRSDASRSPSASTCLGRNTPSNTTLLSMVIERQEEISREKKAADSLMRRRVFSPSTTNIRISFDSVIAELDSAYKSQDTEDNL